MAMALRDEIAAKRNRMQDIEEWISQQSNADEWWEVLRDLAYSNHGVAKLLTKYGMECNHNHVYRVRQKHGLI